jgi:hypothetical protein
VLTCIYKPVSDRSHTTVSLLASADAGSDIALERRPIESSQKAGRGGYSTYLEFGSSGGVSRTGCLSALMSSMRLASVGNRSLLLGT